MSGGWTGGIRAKGLVPFAVGSQVIHELLVDVELVSRKAIMAARHGVLDVAIAVDVESDHDVGVDGWR